MMMMINIIIMIINIIIIIIVITIIKITSKTSINVNRWATHTLVHICSEHNRLDIQRHKSCLPCGGSGWEVSDLCLFSAAGTRLL